MFYQKFLSFGVLDGRIYQILLLNLFLRILPCFISLIFDIEFIHQIFSKKTYLLLRSLASTVDGLHHSIHVFLRIKFHLLLFGKRCRLFMGVITLICHLTLHLVPDHRE